MAAFPSSDEEGRLRHQENAAKQPLKGADGVVLINKRNGWFEPTTPSAPNKEPSDHLIDGAATPP